MTTIKTVLAATYKILFETIGTTDTALGYYEELNNVVNIEVAGYVNSYPLIDWLTDTSIKHFLDWECSGITFEDGEIVFHAATND